MKMTGKHKLLPLMLCLVLIAATALTAAGCGRDIPPIPELPKAESTPEAAETPASVETPAEPAEEIAEPEAVAEPEAPAHFFTLKVVDADGNESSFSITTERVIVGDALLDEGLIAGDAGPYGLYVKQVNGITADYDIDGTYWAFYINGEMAMTGVDGTEIEDGAEYEFRVE